MKFNTCFLLLLCSQLASLEIKEYEARYSYESDEISKTTMFYLTSKNFFFQTDYRIFK